MSASFTYRSEYTKSDAMLTSTYSCDPALFHLLCAIEPPRFALSSCTSHVKLGKETDKTANKRQMRWTRIQSGAQEA
jgi:hypothetical protein